MRNFSLGVELDDLVRMYYYATRDEMHTFCIDIKTKDPRLRFRKDFQPIQLPGIQPESDRVLQGEFEQEKGIGKEKKSEKPKTAYKDPPSIKRKRKEIMNRINEEEGRVTGKPSKSAGNLAPIAHAILASRPQIIPSPIGRGTILPGDRALPRSTSRR